VALNLPIRIEDKSYVYGIRNSKEYWGGSPSRVSQLYSRYIRVPQYRKADKGTCPYKKRRNTEKGVNVRVLWKRNRTRKGVLRMRLNANDPR
jgi:hypothetical protein